MNMDILSVIVYTLWGACFLIGGALITKGIEPDEDYYREQFGICLDETDMRDAA